MYTINMHSWLEFRWGKDLNQQPHQNVSITGTVQAIYGLHQPGRQQRSLHMTDSNTEIETILGSCPVKHTDLMNEATKPVITGAIIMVWTLTRLGTRPGEEKHHLLADTDGARSDRGKLTSPPKNCSKVVLLALTYRCLDVPHRSVRFTHTTCGYTSTIITLHVYICWMFPYLVHASSESFY